MLSVARRPLEPSAVKLDVVDRAAAAAALEARELRLLAYAVGDHLPIELAVEVVALRARRHALALERPAPWRPANLPELRL